MKNDDSRMAVTEDSLHRGVRPKPWEAVRMMELKPTSSWRHSQSMPDSRDPATTLAPAPTAAGSPFGASDSPTRFREDPVYLTQYFDSGPFCSTAGLRNRRRFLRGTEWE